MARTLVGPLHIDGLEAVERTPGWRSITLALDEETGGATKLLFIPDGHIGSPDKSRQFEHHTLQEEIFVLEGSVDFEDYYSAPPRSYINHPPYWLHPAVQRYVGNVVMLLKISMPVDFYNESIPDDWDGIESFSTNPALPELTQPRGEAITKQAFVDAAWTTTENGAHLAHIWHNPVDEWDTWLVDLPSNWTGDLPGGTTGDEMYVVAGDATCDGSVLRPGAYFCNPTGTPFTGPVSSIGGFFAIRWTAPATRLANEMIAAIVSLQA